ncbi:Protein CBG12086 [Caenorhabditis briggsae]|uniref:Uncharacterized protein n=3 Tax=Caenorhabditis briggsae TaxID=6238 RepID=A0AAE9E2Y4_CAEBR|nr:Protein CBG12086 [Caenorhabditis briggsae]UMM12829.1 hypothetical protein L5515_001410 [Caenorhabditis briggsae]CAP31122.1 Protein CBG12086 [Caenorhabditis briggsae]
MSQMWGSTRKENSHNKECSDLQSFIDVGMIIEKIQRENYVRKQKSVQQIEGVANDLMNWKKSHDSDMKSLENQIEFLKMRKEQIRQNSTEMTVLADQLRHRLTNIREMKIKNQQLFGDQEDMQC